MLQQLERNRTQVLERIARAAAAAGRDPAAIELVAVTKSVEPALAAALFELGTRTLGENRADELESKARHLKDQGLVPRWHFVGHLQRNKARRVLALADVIHSVDSERLLETLAEAAGAEGRAPGIYLQVKLRDEASKSGAAPAELPGLVERAAQGPLPLLGLMTIAPLVEPLARGKAEARAVFAELRALAERLPRTAFDGERCRLSMGMSADFEEAIAAGADVLRIGSLFFEGVQPPPPGSQANLPPLAERRTGRRGP